MKRRPEGCTCHYTEEHIPDGQRVTVNFDWEWNPDCPFHKPAAAFPYLKYADGVYTANEGGINAILTAERKRFTTAPSPCPYGNGDHGPLIRQARDEGAAAERERIAAAIEAELVPDDRLFGDNDALRLAAHIARHSHETPC